ncbi:MAG: ornithine cyclodeaminase family protein, partial [Pseudomonadota bacterium]
MNFVDRKRVEALLPMNECVPLMRKAMTAMGRGETQQPLRTIVKVPEEMKLMGAMPGYIPEGRLRLGAKVMSVFFDNFARGLPSHQGVICLFDHEDGHLAAIVDGDPVTAIRTAAATAVATDVAASEDAETLVLVGYGEQARRHAESIPLVRSIKRILITGRNFDSAKALAVSLDGIHEQDVKAEQDIETAVRQGDIVCTLTHAVEPIVKGEWLLPGCHVNAVGAGTRGFREIDATCVQRSRFFGDFKEGIKTQSEEFITPLENGEVTDADLLCDLGEILARGFPIRETAQDITCFKSLGNVVQDLYAAAHVASRHAESASVG